jgi:hypothetical protein
MSGSSLCIQLEQRTKGESDTAVAAASILARERFIDWMDQTTAACGIRLPLGASDTVIQAARELVARDGPEILGKVANCISRPPPPCSEANHPPNTLGDLSPPDCEKPVILQRPQGFFQIIRLLARKSHGNNRILGGTKPRLS